MYCRTAHRQRERILDECLRRMMAATTPQAQRHWLGRIGKLIRCRPPEEVAAIERARGLRQ